jgi:hypothetical protein
MKWRDFPWASAVTATTMASPCVRAAGAESADAALSLSKSGPNNLDIMGVGTKTPGYGVVITYDRLVTFGTKPDAKGVDNDD